MMERDPLEDGLRGLRTDSRGAQERFIARVRGRLLGLLRRRPRPAAGPLADLEAAVRAQVAFLARHPQLPERMLRLSLEAGTGRIRRRIGGVLGRYEQALARIIERARSEGAMAASVEPRREARLLIALIGGLVLRMRFEARQAGDFEEAAQRALEVYLRGLRG